MKKRPKTMRLLTAGNPRYSEVVQAILEERRQMKQAWKMAKLMAQNGTAISVSRPLLRPSLRRTGPRQGEDGLSELVDRLVDGIADRVSQKLAKRPQENGGSRHRLLSVAEAAAYIGRTKRATEHLIADGELTAVRQGRRVFLDSQDLDRWIDDSKG